MTDTETTEPEIDEMPEKVVTRISSSLPYPGQIKWLKISPDEIRFEWRGSRFKVTQYDVEEIQGVMLAGTDLAMLVHTLLIKQKQLEEK